MLNDISMGENCGAEVEIGSAIEQLRGERTGSKPTTITTKDKDHSAQVMRERPEEQRALIVSEVRSPLQQRLQKSFQFSTVGHDGTCMGTTNTCLYPNSCDPA